MRVRYFPFEFIRNWSAPHTDTHTQPWHISCNICLSHWHLSVSIKQYNQVPRRKILCIDFVLFGNFPFSLSEKSFTTGGQCRNCGFLPSWNAPPCRVGVLFLRPPRSSYCPHPPHSNQQQPLMGSSDHHLSPPPTTHHHIQSMQQCGCQMWKDIAQGTQLSVKDRICAPHKPSQVFLGVVGIKISLWDDVKDVMSAS